MTSGNEENGLISHTTDNNHEQPRPFLWRIIQGAHYIMGSVCFTAGSCMYFTKVFHPHLTALSAGGWLFTIGSVIFLLADLQDWWDYRTGYCFSYKYHSISDIPLDELDISASSDGNDDKKIELNVYGSITGSAFYLAGSILFIPIFENYLLIGEWFFIFGSACCYLSLLWKMYRTACNNSNQKFKLLTLFNDKLIFTMDIFSVIGNVCFFIGTILFLSYINKTDFDENRAAFLFVLGSGSFIISSSILQYTICYSNRK